MNHSVLVVRVGHLAVTWNESKQSEWFNAFFYLRYTSDEYKKHDCLAFIFILLTVFLFATCNSEDEGEKYWDNATDAKK